MKAPLKEYSIEKVLRLFKVYHPNTLQTLTPYFYKSTKGEMIEFEIQFDFTDKTFQTFNIVRVRDGEIKGFFKTNKTK